LLLLGSLQLLLGLLLLLLGLLLLTLLARELTDALLDTLADALRRLSRALPEALDTLGGALAEALRRLSRALSHLAERLTRALSHLWERLLGALADPAETLVGALSDVAEGRARALADLRQRLAGALPHFLDGIAGFVEQVPGPTADLLHGVAHPFEKLGIAVEREKYALEDLRDVVETGLEQRLRLDSLDLQLDLSEVSMGADFEVQQLSDLGEKGDAHVEVIDLDVDLVDLDDGNVDEHVGALGSILWVKHGVVRELLALALAAA